MCENRCYCYLTASRLVVTMRLHIIVQASVTFFVPRIIMSHFFVPPVRCTRVIIAGPSMERGRKTSAFAQLACNNLRCIQCNFKVHCFANSAWDSSVDYMFLRNTVPNEVKLAQRLQRSAESCAYCCQCSHTNESGERELTAQTSSGDPQWVCAGH